MRAAMILVALCACGDTYTGPGLPPPEQYPHDDLDASFDVAMWSYPDGSWWARPQVEAGVHDARPE